MPLSKESIKGYISSNLIPVGIVVVSLISTYFAVHDNTAELDSLKESVDRKQQHFYDYRDEHSKYTDDKEKEYQQIIFLLQQQLNRQDKEIRDLTERLDGTIVQLEDYKERIKYLERRR